ncbi:MAG TPA: isoprenylcysteine carboxylmethyltransferase family protein, partial [Thermoanaerobaculia bacterium]|nr:isoprenylcysteine carboxylmethyltransferase family protein [Thermoanaerobaculia bacterium]
MAMLLGFGAAWLARAATFSAHRLPAFWSGIAVMLCGALLRRHCFRVLGAFFNGAVTVREDHRVIDSGAYRWIRHPSYTGGMAIFLGIGIALANWVSLACLTVIPIAAYSYRILVEERALMLRIGEPYRDYARRTKRLIPFVL